MEVSVLRDDELPPPRDTFKYKSRNTIKYDDDRPECSPERENEDQIMNKTSQAYLEKMKEKLEKEMLRNDMMIEAEK